MPASAAIGAGTSLVGNLVGGGKASSAQSQASNQAAQQQQQVMNMISGFQQYAAPLISNLVGTLSGWTGINPSVLGALTTNSANAGMSDIKTAESQGAFGANQNAAAEEALFKNQQQTGTNMVNAASQASQQELGAMESIPGAINTLNPVQGGSNTLSGLSSSNQQTAAGYGNPWAPAAGSIGTGLSLLQPNTSTNTATGYTPAATPPPGYGTNYLGPNTYTPGGGAT